MVIIAAVDRTDLSQSVVEQAHALAAAFDDDVHVVHVLKPSEFMSLEQSTIEETGHAVEITSAEEFAAEAARQAAETVDEPSTPVGLVGPPSDEIIRYADTHDARYIVVGPKNRSPTGKVLFGSVTQSVLLNADCPVVSINAE